jgi:flagellar biosynthesis GTPase FlhF
MKLKSYFAGTVESAICLARQEMGGDAMLVNSRRTLPESRHLGAYEVVFAAAQDSVRHAVATAVHADIEEPAKPQSATLAGEMAEMRRQLTRMSSLVSRSAVRNGLRSTTASNPALDGLDHTLAANDVDGDLACSMLRNLESLGLAASAAEIGDALRKDIQKRITVSAELSPWSFETAPGPGAAPARTIAALVGPPGVGKTTMLAKLAMRFGVSARRATHIISYDSHRIAPNDQLRSYAAIMGVGFEALETVGSLGQSLKDNTR